MKLFRTENNRKFKESKHVNSKSKITVVTVVSNFRTNIQNCIEHFNIFHTKWFPLSKEVKYFLVTGYQIYLELLSILF